MKSETELNNEHKKMSNRFKDGKTLLQWANEEDKKPTEIPCPNCQGCGCPTCNGFGHLFEYPDNDTKSTEGENNEK